MVLLGEKGWARSHFGAWIMSSAMVPGSGMPAQSLMMPQEAQTVTVYMRSLYQNSASALQEESSSMIATMVTIITLILLFFVIWRMTSRSFRERCERPKHLFVESRDALSESHPHPLHHVLSQETTDETTHS